MLKGQGNASPKTNLSLANETSLEPVEKTKKKLSFREPEIMGYYMQIGQDVASRLSKKFKSKNGTKTPAMVSKSCIFKNCASEDKDMNYEHFTASTEDLNLEVGLCVFLNLDV